MSYDEKTVLAIDPGSRKCGLALVRRINEEKLEIVWRSIVPTEELVSTIAQAMELAQFEMVIVGSGTRSQDAVSAIREAYKSLGVMLVDEKNTTLEARARYWLHHSRPWWRKVIPASMQEPKEPVDDFVAVILAERVLLMK